MQNFISVVRKLLDAQPDTLRQRFSPDKATISPETLNDAFMQALAGDTDTKKPALGYLEKIAGNTGQDTKLRHAAQFYLAGLTEINREIDAKSGVLPELNNALKQPDPAEKPWEQFWAVFFPEALDTINDSKAAVKSLREKRRIEITNPNPDPIDKPIEQILFTSNVLLTLPPADADINTLDLPPELKQKIHAIADEPQRYWYDHPIPIGITPEQNEILYGLRNLDQAIEFERQRGTFTEGELSCILSVSVTHQGLQAIAKDYIEDLMNRHGRLKHIALYIFTEEDTQKLIYETLAPVARHYLHTEDAEKLLTVFGVDGEYGRHYSFLKAIAALWQLTINPNIKATFKIDLDQVFPQEKLVEQTGHSAFEHFKNPYWGAEGTDYQGNPVTLSMIAGALVNESDIHHSLFTPDVKLTASLPIYDEWVFHSKLPQAISTEAEMMTRANDLPSDTVLQRVHVTGGTNGILIDSLKHYRPFTPSFIGRAEDQAYILSVMHQSPRLAYLHAPGLIMRHDKEAFAQQAIESAAIGKLIGDYIRILYFSAYADTLPQGAAHIKENLQPFTGCFISNIPKTVVWLRFCLKAARFFNEEQTGKGRQFILEGAQRLLSALAFIDEEKNLLADQYQYEQQGWELFYNSLEQLGNALNAEDSFTEKIKQSAMNVFKQTYISAQD